MGNYVTSMYGLVSDCAAQTVGFTCTVKSQRYGETDVKLTNNSPLYQIENIYGFTSPNSPYQSVMMDNKNNIYMSNVDKKSIYTNLYIAKKYGILTSGASGIFIIDPNKIDDDNFKSMPENNDNDKIKKLFYSSYLVADNPKKYIPYMDSTYQQKGKDDCDMCKYPAEYWDDSKKLSLTYNKLYDADVSKFCVKINSQVDKLTDDMKKIDCRFVPDGSPDINISYDVEDSSIFAKKIQDNALGIGICIGVTFCILIIIGLVIFFVISSSKGKKHKK